MFEQEIELEKKQSAAVPLLLMVALIVVLVGIAVHFLQESRKVLSQPEAKDVVTRLLKAQGPITVSFHTGSIKQGYAEDPTDVRYRFLEKAGVLTIGKAKGGRVPVALTQQGKDMLKGIEGIKESKNDEGNPGYEVPLAVRSLVDISKITMAGPERASVQYSWRWQPNALGEKFDAAGPILATFNSWDRVAMIDKYGSRFYHDPPTKVAVALAKTDQGWQIATE